VRKTSIADSATSTYAMTFVADFCFWWRILMERDFRSITIHDTIIRHGFEEFVTARMPTTTGKATTAKG
jgi:hypothetical protein